MTEMSGLSGHLCQNADLPEEFIMKLNKTIVLVRRTEMGILLLLGAGATAVMFINALCRYAFHITFVWAEEVIRIAFVWSMFIAISDSFIHNEHIGFKNLANINKTTQLVSDLIYNLSLFFVGLLLSYYGWKYNRMTGDVPLAGTNLPTAVFMWPGIGAGIIWMLTGGVRAVLALIGRRPKTSPKEVIQ
jgi:TRAP-type C4-dicarboxylate transport system permease small subunit